MLGTNVSVARALREALALPWRTARGWSSVALGLELLAGLLPAAAAYCVKLLVDALSAPAVSPETVSAAVIASVACTALLSLTSLAASHVGSRLRSATGLAVDAELFRAVEARFERLDELETPAWQNKVRLAESAAQQVPGQVTELGYSALRTVVTLSALAAVVAQAAASLALLLFALAAVTTWAQLSRSGDDARSEAAFVQQWRWREFYRALLLEPRAAKEVRLFGLGEFLVGRLAGRTLKAQAARFAAERVRLLIQGGFVVAAATVTAVGAWWVATEAARHHLRPGDVTLFLAAAGGLHSALGGFVASVALGGRSLLLFRHYLELVEAAAQHRRAGRPSLAAGPLCEAIELRDVWFRYSDDGPWVLRGVDLTLRRGQALGLVGLNGAGKSTLVKVLCGLHRPQLGRVLWDGRDLAALSAASLRARIAAVFQDFMTYELTAAENIGLGRLAQLDDPVAISRAAQLAGIAPALLALPRGYQTLLSRSLDAETLEGDPSCGAALSGGQWQRLAVARALMRTDADLMVLDEPASGLDAAAEVELNALLTHRSLRTTRVLISHRLSSIRGADQIAVLSEGRITERGSHDQLMVRGAAYARLFRAQAARYQDARVAAGAS